MRTFFALAGLMAAAPAGAGLLTNAFAVTTCAHSVHDALYNSINAAFIKVAG